MDRLQAASTDDLVHILKDVSIEDTKDITTENLKEICDIILSADKEYVHLAFFEFLTKYETSTTAHSRTSRNENMSFDSYFRDNN